MLPSADFTFNELTEWYLPILQHKADAGELSAMYHKEKLMHLNSFNRVLGDFVVNQIQTADLDRYRAARKRAQLSDSYVDQEIGAAKSMIICGFDNGKVGADSLRVFRRVKKLLKRGANARKAVLSFADYNRLTGALPYHARSIVQSAFWTGMRRGEILNLTWDKVDLKARMIRLTAGDTKEGRAKRVPIAATLSAVLEKLPRALHDPHVFLNQGARVLNISTAFKNAVTNIGLNYGRKAENGLVFHDIRHSTKTFMRKAGIDRNIRMLIFGHSDGGNDMDARYDTVDDADLIAAIDKFEQYLLTNADRMQTRVENLAEKQN